MGQQPLVRTLQRPAEHFAGSEQADVGAIFPVRHLANALLIAYNPHTTGLGFAGLDLLIVAAWGAVGLLIALRTFSWQPLGR